MFPQLYMGWTALRVSSSGLDIIGQNVANAANPNYHRQSVNQMATAPVWRDGQWYGTGVDIHSISRARHGVLEVAIAENHSMFFRFDAHLSAQRHVESLLTPSEGGLTGRVQTFFGQMEGLSARPDDAVERRQLVNAARDMALELNRVMGSIQTLRGDLHGQIRSTIQEVHDLSQRIIEINQQISVARSRGGNPNTLLDQRDALVHDLSALVDVDVNEPENFVLVAQGGVILGPNGGQQIRLQTAAAGQLQLVRDGDGAVLELAGGKLAGLLEAYNGLRDHEQQLDELGFGLIRAIDQRHATGVGLSGPFSELTSARRVSDVNAPLANASLPFDLSAGELTVTVTDSTTGERSLHTISWDPAVDSLSSIAGKLSGIPFLQATVNAGGGQLAIFAEPGHRFDFTGGVATLPTDQSAWSGSTQPVLSGLYSGSANETFTFELSGGGEIGVTPGLSVLVKNTVGDVVQTLNVGQGYAAGTPLDVVDGVQVAFDLGTVQAGDQFTARAIADSDTAGLLSALAVNTMFVGDGAHNLAVHPDLLADPRRLATSLNGDAGDASNLLRMIDARGARVAAGGTATIEDFSAQMVSDVGGDVRQLQLETEHANLIGARLASEREAISGVNPDEELVLMLQYQRSYQAAARFVTAIRDTTAELMNLIQ